MKPLIIFGAGGFAQEVIWLVRQLDKEWQILGILDAGLEKQSNLVCGVPVLGTGEACTDYLDAWFIVAIAAPRSRRKVVGYLHGKGIRHFATLIHPSVLHSEYVQFGEGTVVCAGTIATTEISIGSHCIINLGVTIGHEVSIGDYCTLAPHATISGRCRLKDGVEVGSGAIMLPGVTVSVGSLVAAGSVVSKPISGENSVCAGSPARYVKSLESFV